MTDLNFIACARKLLALRGRIFPQFATHNALTVAEVIECAGGVEGYEFQRLHGMGEALYHRLLETTPGAVCRVYAPVGGHKNLLAYLVRRLLENGANSSFISEAADPDVPVEQVLQRPQAIIGAPESAAQPKLPLPRDLFAPVRANSHGVEFGNRDALEELLAERDRAGNAPLTAQPLLDGKPVTGVSRKAVARWAQRPGNGTSWTVRRKQRNWRSAPRCPASSNGAAGLRRNEPMFSIAHRNCWKRGEGG
jgi:RHH-type transcriptional regulator, proline utilization regulon repressor / proline dehydrogenase / delta 1-pyrroline-5-carboxylate dehydrogenase